MRMTANSSPRLRRMIEAEQWHAARTRLDRAEIKARHLSKLRRRQVQPDLTESVPQGPTLRH